MATITPVAESPGKGGKRRMFSGTPRPVVVRYYTFDFDSSYPTGGESISSIFDDFQLVLQITPEQRGSRIFAVDYSGKKLLLYTAVGTQGGSASDQSTITGVRLEVTGY